MITRTATLSVILSIFTFAHASGQVNPYQHEIFWQTRGTHAIAWDLTTEERLPHNDNIEMSGQRVAGIIHYSIDEKRNLKLVRHLIFPQLRVYIEASASPWLQYRAYLKQDYTDELLPVIVAGRRTFEPGPVDSVRIGGMITFYHAAEGGLMLKRTLLPSMTKRLFTESWELTNASDTVIACSIGHIRFEKEQSGLYGQYRRVVRTDARQEVSLEPGETYSFGIYFEAYLDDEPPVQDSIITVVDEREAFLDTIRQNLVLETPDPVLNTLFYFSKIRAAESIYSTPMGLVHSPGGGRYYAGVWANDQAEYSGPFFPYLGYETGESAAMNAYRVFLNNIPGGDGHFWSSFEMNGDLTCCGADRGDAAMIAFGASHFALASGDPAIAIELWPLIEWCLDYCDRHTNEEGVVLSDTDEMEGRISTGGANLSTSALYYGALLLAADLAKAINLPPSQAGLYEKQAKDLAASMEIYFGATIEGLDTYRYFKGHDHLRHWICLPLVMGINDRREGTLEALFSKLWTDNGVRVEYNPELAEPDLFWDRGTLYAFRGAFRAGAADRGLEKLLAYSITRLLGFHVPYVVEAWPEGNMAHLSAESALYCRIFTEGLLGINPTGLDRFNLTPWLPGDWDSYKLEHIRAFNSDVSVYVERRKDGLSITVMQDGKSILAKKVANGETMRVNLD